MSDSPLEHAAGMLTVLAAVLGGAAVLCLAEKIQLGELSESTSKSSNFQELL
jgi:hypothetical protein